jgi:hypothetical protein
MSIEQRKDEIIDQINSDIFGDTSASQQECIDALEEIADTCRTNIAAIKHDMDKAGE